MIRFQTCDPHSTLTTPNPTKLSILIGNLQPSDPPRPNLPMIIRLYN